MNIDLSFSAASIWALLGVVLVLAEFAMPGVVLLFFGVAALLIAVALWAGVEMSVNVQILIFGALAIGLVAGARERVKTWFYGKSEHAREGVETLAPGTQVTALSDFVDGAGLVSYRGARWNAECADPVISGQRLWIVGRRSLVLEVSASRPSPASSDPA